MSSGPLRPIRLARDRRVFVIAVLLLMVMPLSQAEIARAQQCSPSIVIDTPSDNATLRDPGTAVGWAADLASPSGAGVDAVHVYLDGEAGTGKLLGGATIGLDRPDVAAAYGSPRAKAGWSLPIDLSAAQVGGHALYIYAETRCGWSFERQVVNVAPADGWALLNPPPARNSHAAVWDPVRGQMLAIGGRGGVALADLWSYHAATETWMPLAGPDVPLVGHTAVWDPTNDQMLVFGGFGGGGSSDVTLWSYRPATNVWQALQPDGSSPNRRAYHSAVWDGDTNQMLIFGGIGSHFEPFNDVWSYDPATNSWEQLAANVLFAFLAHAPEGRFYHSAVWDPTGHQMLVFAGASPEYGLLDDLWSFDPVSGDWTDLDPPDPAPEARLSQTAVWDPIGSRMLVFAGGCGGCYLDDFWAYDPSANTWTQISSSGGHPQARGGQSGVWDTTHNEMLIFGGSSFNDLWSYQPATGAWRQRASREAPAPAAAGQRVLWDAANQQMLVFGGRTSRDAATDLSTLLSFSPKLNVWKSVKTTGPSPSARLGHSVVLDPTTNRAFLFGGSAGDGKGLADLWSYDLSTSTWTRLSPEGPAPSARAVHSAIWDPVDATMLVFGGAPDTSTAFDDLWSYQPSTNRWTQLAATGGGPTPRSRHSAVWDDANRQMLVFGGYALNDLSPVGGYTNELWSYSVSKNSWTKLNAAGPQPPARARHTATWDPQSREMLVFGGYVGGIDYLADLWSYQPSTGVWTQLNAKTATPRSRGDHSAIWDPTSDSVLLYGGTGGDVSNDLWSYRPPPASQRVLGPSTSL